jgi:hypothetical protein
MKKYLTILVFLLVVTYLLTAIVVGSWNPMGWTLDNRTAFVTLIIGDFFIAMFVQFWIEILFDE